MVNERLAKQQCIAFSGSKRIASGGLLDVSLAAKAVVDRDNASPILIFDTVTSKPIEVDFRGSGDDVTRRLKLREEEPTHPAPAEENVKRSPGRPKLGVVAREVTLLPRHWEWLSAQPGGASVALRKLVENARRANADTDRVREAKESLYRFMYAMAGNEAGFEEASRALYADDLERFEASIASWPIDIRDHARDLAARVFPQKVDVE